MITMQNVSRQGLSHDIQPDASANYSDTGWSGGFERDGSEIYEYISHDNFLKIRIWEQFEEDENGYINKQYSSWVIQVWYDDEEQYDLCDVNGIDATKSLENVLKKIKYINYITQAREGWRTSYQNIAGKVFAPIWI